MVQQGSAAIATAAAQDRTRPARTRDGLPQERMILIDIPPQDTTKKARKTYVFYIFRTA
jgi:hypothetical protein